MLKEYLPQPEGFAHAHCASLNFHNGEIYCVWYVYNNEEYQNARLALSQFNNSLKRWTQPKLILPNQGKSQGNPCLFSFENEQYVLFVLLEGHYWNSAALHIGRLNHQRMELEDIHKFKVPQGIMVRHRPLISDSTVIIPAYDEDKNQTIIFEMKAPFKELVKRGSLEPGPIQGEIVPFKSQEIMMVLRPTNDGRMVMRAQSPDGGKSFPFPAYKTPFHCPLSGIAAARDSQGHLLVAHNNTEKHQRSPLNLSSSLDGLKSMYKSIEIQFGSGEYSYPSMVFDNNRALHLVFTNNREKIGHFMLYEDDLKVLFE